MHENWVNLFFYGVVELWVVISFPMIVFTNFTDIFVKGISCNAITSSLVVYRSGVIKKYGVYGRRKSLKWYNER